MNWQSNRNKYLFALVALIFVVLIVPITFLGPQRYSAYATGIQAIGVLIALILAVLTLGADRHDKQIDRVLALHSELVMGEVQGCRARLTDHLRKRGGSYVQRATRDDLYADPRLSTYDENPEHIPLYDANTILRFFERANAAVKAKTVYEPLFHELIIRHALWWNDALPACSTPWAGRVALGELASWGYMYEEAHGEGLVYLASWRASLERDFGSYPESTASRSVTA